MASLTAVQNLSDKYDIVLAGSGTVLAQQMEVSKINGTIVTFKNDEHLLRVLLGHIYFINNTYHYIEIDSYQYHLMRKIVTRRNNEGKN